MYNGKYSVEKDGKCRHRWSKNTALIVAIILLLCVTIGGTIAYLITKSDTVVNTFVPANVDIEIEETVLFNTKEKISIRNVENESNIPVYIRVALVGNWVDANGRICINHSRTPPTFTIGNNWLTDGGFYYYKFPVEVGDTTTNLLGSGSGIELKADDDGCSYQVEVIASAIQTEPVSAVIEAWGFNPAA